MTIFLSSSKFQEIDCELYADAKPPYSGTRYWGDIAEDMENRLIPKLLISLSASLRIKHDDGSWWIENERNVGKLFPDLNTKNEEILSLREACNKIIHAKSVHYDIEPIGSFEHIKRQCRYLNPFIYLYGTKYDKNWKAMLDVRQFATGCLNVVF
jgi:hypothetical protein